MHPWFQVKAQQNNKTEVYILDAIGSWGMTAKDFIESVRASKPLEIDLHINSPGGSVFDGLAIFNYLKNSGAVVNVFVDGLAASIASIIAMAGNTISMAQNAFMMIHNPIGYIDGGNASDMEKSAEFLRKIEEQMAAIYEGRSGKSREKVKAWMDDVSYFTAQECLDNGLADKITGAIQATAHFDLTAFGKVPDALARSQKPQPKNTKNDMLKIIALLGAFGVSLPADATEDQVAEKLKAFLDEFKAETEAAKAEAAKLAAEAKAAKEADVKAFVDSAVEQKKITADVSASWVKTILANDEARKLLAEIKPPASAPLPPEQTAQKPDAPKLNAIDAVAAKWAAKYPFMK
jgi:ATP-dependent Clp endopeptidase proteolytic subunit ClpP